MADDTPDTPETPTVETPAPRRRAAARKTADKPATPRKPRGTVARAEDAASRAVTATKDAVVAAEERVVRAVRPRSTSRATTARKAAAKTGGAAKTAGGEGATPRPRNKPGPKPGSKRAAKAPVKSTFDRATDAIGGRVVAATLGALAAAGATAAAVLTLRGSSSRGLGAPKKPVAVGGAGDAGKTHPTTATGGAHQPDGTDSSASFKAGIADENTVPDKD